MGVCLSSRLGAGLGDFLPQLETLVLTYNYLEELVSIIIYLLQGLVILLDPL